MAPHNNNNNNNSSYKAPFLKLQSAMKHKIDTHKIDRTKDKHYIILQNKCDLTFFLKTLTEGHCLRPFGNPFQHFGATTEKALSPTDFWVLGV